MGTHVAKRVNEDERTDSADKQREMSPKPSRKKLSETSRPGTQLHVAEKVSPRATAATNDANHRVSASGISGINASGTAKNGRSLPLGFAVPLASVRLLTTKLHPTSLANLRLTGVPGRIPAGPSKTALIANPDVIQVG